MKAMDDFDIDFDGYTPARTPMSSEPYRPPKLDGPYAPPRLDEEEERETFKSRPVRETQRQEAPKAETRSERSEEKPIEDSTEQRRRERDRRIRELKKVRESADRPIAIVRFFTDERTRLFLAATLIFGSIFLLIAIFSHFTHGAGDQSATLNLPLKEIAEKPGIIQNSGGGFGAWLSHLMICDALGLGSLVLIPYMWILAFGLLGLRKCNFWGTTFRCLLLAITISVVLGFITYTWSTVIYWGGNHGHYVNKFLFENTTWIGALIVSLLLVTAVCCVYLNELRNGWHKWRAAYHRHKLQEELRRARRRELDNLEAEEEADRLKAEKEKKDNASTTDKPKVHEKPITAVSDDDEELVLIDHDDESYTSDEPKGKTNVEGFMIDLDPTGDPGAKISDNFEVEAPKIEEADPSVKGPVHEMDGLYDHRAELPHFQFPTIELLEDRPSGPIIDLEEQQANKALIEKTLLDYRIPISHIKATVGPTVTLYEIVPAEGVRISQIKRLEDDIALSLKALGIRIIAPIPGKGTVGIEVPNNEPQTVSMRAVINSKKYQECKMALPMAMGATISNEIFIADLAKMPHLLVAGATGMGKSVGLNAIIASLLYKKHPSEIKFVLIDPKMVEFSLYSKLERHYLAKLPNEEDAIITDMKKVIQTLNSLCVEMDSRYELLRDANVRSLEEYNKKFTERRLNANNGHHYMPYIVVIVDEFADLIMTQGKEIETPIARIAQKARAVGIHMILATQRPSTNVITGLIKANFPGRIAFRVAQMVDSRTILDAPGANQLIGRGDMLFSHNGSMERVQCAFISTEEVEAMTQFIDDQVGYEHAFYLPEFVPEEAEGGAIAGGSMERDSLFNDAARFVVTRQLGSTSSLQRQFGIGYNRAGKLMDQMEAAGIVGPVNGAKPRAILMDIVTLESILGD